MTDTHTPGSTVTSRLGEVLRDGDGVRLEFVRHYATDAADVWSAVTDPDRLARWLGPWSGDPSTGSVTLTMAAEDGAPGEQVTIDECDPPRRLAVTMASGDGPWPLVVTLSEQGGGTTLRFVHHLAEPYDASAVGPGWQYYLDRLDAVLTGGPVPEDFDAYHPSLAGSYPIPPAQG